MHARRLRPDDRPHSLDSEPRGDPAPPQRAALWLQRAAGNHAAAGVLSRDPDTQVKPTPKNVTAKGIPPEHKDADKSWAPVIKDDVKNIAPFLKRLREIALKADSKK